MLMNKSSPSMGLTCQRSTYEQSVRQSPLCTLLRISLIHSSGEESVQNISGWFRTSPQLCIFDLQQSCIVDMYYLYKYEVLNVHLTVKEWILIPPMQFHPCGPLLEHCHCCKNPHGFKVLPPQSSSTVLHQYSFQKFRRNTYLDNGIGILRCIKSLLYAQKPYVEKFLIHNDSLQS